ncbi:hypothetical protein DdX_01082 [Ditylenchus destructor]|uniref:Uncharacterized protein n=1 Tax=Ditylenchus destructor TaxID=166010 RepID=A0AAD4NL59_9BILA|nr:hypothetical protein DdX_01082 [Ditylenchus destructor]
MLPESHSPRQGLALSDLQSTSSSSSSSSSLDGHNNKNPFSIGGGVISGLAIASNGSSSWSTRGVGGIGAGLLSHPSSQSAPFGGLGGGSGIGMKLGGGNNGSFGCGSSSSGQGLFGGSSASSSSSCRNSNNGPFADFSSTNYGGGLFKQ